MFFHISTVLVSVTLHESYIHLIEEFKPSTFRVNINR